jgi:hypothetical protein
LQNTLAAEAHLAERQWLEEHNSVQLKMLFEGFQRVSLIEYIDIKKIWGGKKKLIVVVGMKGEDGNKEG